jgi:dethiobiotin synthetase
MSTYFVTATGTDLGKTYVLCRILAQLRSRGAARACAEAGAQRL